MSVICDTRINGAGICLRSTHYDDLLHADKSDIPWFEILADNYLQMRGIAWDKLLQITHNIPTVLHCVGLGIGNSHALDWSYCQKIKMIALQCKSQWISDHLCWTSFDNYHSHSLLPLPYTDDVVRHVSERIKALQDFFQLPLLIENIASYLSASHSTMPEVDFINAIIEKTDCGILLDVNNLVVNAHNHQYDAREYLHRIARENVYQYHLAGHVSRHDLLIDTHDQTVSDNTWHLFENAIACIGSKPACIEWDNDIPAFSQLMCESKRLSHFL